MDKFITRSRPEKRASDEHLDRWRSPKRTAASGSNQDKPAHCVVTSNRYENLPVDESTDPAKTQFIKATTKVKKTGHIPPILLQLKKEWTHNLINELVLKHTKQFHLHYRGRAKVAIICYSAEAHQAVKEGLRADNLEFLTYTRKDEKSPKAVIRGLPAYVENELADELGALGFKGVKTTKLKSSRSEESLFPPFLVQLAAGEDMAKFRHIKYLFNCAVTINKFKTNQKSGTQCYRCQRFGHTSKNCNMPARCVKCTEDHPIGECTKKDRTEPARCVNCNENHSANYSQCSARIKYLERIQRKTEERKPKATFINPSRPIDPSQTWANIAAKPIASQANPLPQDQTTKEMLDILQAIKKVKPQFASCPTMLDKVMLILTHLGNYV